jgi:hypothetical protein
MNPSLYPLIKDFQSKARKWNYLFSYLSFFLTLGHIIIYL